MEQRSTKPVSDRSQRGASLSTTFRQHVTTFRDTAWLAFRNLYPRVEADDLWPPTHPRPESSTRGSAARPGKPTQSRSRAARRVLDGFELSDFSSLTNNEKELADFAALIVGRKRSGVQASSPDAALGSLDLQPFGMALATHAVSDAGLRWSVASFARRVLERRVVFYPGGPPHVTLSATTFLWIMDAMRILPRLLTATNQIQDPYATLGLIGRELEQEEGWAGFWDQFFLSEALRVHGRASTVVQRLPLVANGLASLVMDPADDPPSVEADWRNHVPTFAVPLMKGMP